MKAQINSEKKLTEEAVKKLFQIVQEKKTKSSGIKNGNESKRLEKEYKRLQLELSKERENYAQMHKALNQEIQSLKEDLDKREQEVFKCRTLMNNSINSSAAIQSHHSNHHHHHNNNGNNHHHHHNNSSTSSASTNNNGHSHHHSSNSNNKNSLVVASNGAANTTFSNLNASSPLNSTANLSSYSLTSINNNNGNGQQHHVLHHLPLLHNHSIYSNNDNSTLIDADVNQDRLENWLSIPNKRNIKKHGWKKLYVVLRKGKLFFYNSLKDNKESQEPYMTIDLEKVYHVRAVTQTDVVRAGTRDVAKIFQILYDVDAVSGPGSITYLGGNESSSHIINSSVGNSLLKKTGNFIASALDNSPSILSSNHGSNNINNSSHATTLSTTTLQNADNFSDSAISTTMRSINGIPDEFSARLNNADSISVGSNDSGEVNHYHFFFSLSVFF